MIITKKIIITDTNIITDLNTAGVLDKFIFLDNVYISDMVLNDEINASTCDIHCIKKMKVIHAKDKEIEEIYEIAKRTKGLSAYDIINFILARNNDGILATGDKKLHDFAKSNHVEVIRTLKILTLMKEKNIISKKEMIDACKLLKEDKTTRIPKESIEDVIHELEKDLV